MLRGDSQDASKKLSRGCQDFTRRLPQFSAKGLKVALSFFRVSKKLPRHAGFQGDAENSQDLLRGFPKARRDPDGDIVNSQESTGCDQEAPAGSWEI